MSSSVSRSASGSVSSSSSSEDEAVKQKNREDAAYRRIVPRNVNVPPMAYTIDVITLCGQAKTDVRLYAGPREKPRRDVYKKDNVKVVKKVSRQTTIRVLKQDALKNSRTMAISVGIFGGLGSLGWLAGPVGGAPGTSLGIALGMGVGGLIIKKSVDRKINIAITFSDHYAEWRAKAITTKVYPIFRNFIETDDVFEDFFCPISQDICSVPMLAPDGRTYDQSQINDYIASLGAGDDDPIVSPIRGKSFCKNDLIVNTQYCRDLVKKAEEVYDDVVRYGRDNEIKHGVAAVIKNTQDLMEGIRIQVAFQLYYAYDDDVRNHRLTEDERDAILRSENSIFDETEAKLKEKNT